MHNLDKPYDILNFWKSVELFTPCKLETEKKFGCVKSIQKTVSGDNNIPWLAQSGLNNISNDTHVWIYTVFLGIITFPHITKEIKNLLNVNMVDYDLKQCEKNVSTVVSFQVKSNGKPIANTLIIPDYILSLSSLSKRLENPNTWLDQIPIIKKKLEDAYYNFQDRLNQTNNYSKITYNELYSLLKDMLDLANLNGIKKHISNTSMIYSSCIDISKKQNHDSKDELTTASEIINSFYIQDLKYVSKECLSHYSSNGTKNKIGTALEDYLSQDHGIERFDFRQDKKLLEKYSSPSLLPLVRWPAKGNHPLYIAQQIAVNIALSKNKGLFSINGPPGTGKTTLLRDIISGVILKRAEVLAEFNNPTDAFEQYTTILIEGFTYKPWKLKDSLLGHEIVVASSNNSAVENISKELPISDSIDEKWELDYFSEISSYALGQDSWGLCAAALGNKTNCNNFFARDWGKKPSSNLKDKDWDKYGLRYYLESSPKSNWQKAKEKFLLTLEKSQKLQKDIIELENIIKTLPLLKGKHRTLQENLFELDNETNILSNKIVEHELELANLKKACNSQKILIENYKYAKPHWIRIIIDFFTKNNEYKNWQNIYLLSVNKLQLINNKIDSSSKIVENLYVKNSKLKILQKTLKNNISLIKKELDSKENIYFANYEEMQQNFPFEGFWDLPDLQLQVLSPWLNEKQHELRGQLFVDAMNLHKSFIINCSTQIKNNINSLNCVINRANLWPELHNHLLQSLWASLCIVTPVISTAFASFANLFKGIGKESLGYLLIDEGGQAPPQAVAGAIYRSKRAFIVGDPLQIKPVATIPKALNNVLMNYHKVSSRWDPLEHSAQTIADRINPWGTYIGKNNNELWVGCPLRVHRRCLDPMFSVANEIAYDNLMIQATKNKKSPIEQVYQTSFWMNVKDGKFNGHWSEKEGKAVLEILVTMINANKHLPSLYIITPFREVTNNIKIYLKTRLKFEINFLSEDIIRRWIDKSVGTIHTFQGKQAQGVILLLGGNPMKQGGISWASFYPNMLNVAITRAQNLLFVVGNHDIWSKRNYYQDLSYNLEKKEYIEKIF